MNSFDLLAGVRTEWQTPNYSSANCWPIKPDCSPLINPIDRDLVADLDRLGGSDGSPETSVGTGTRQAYHAVTLGFFEGELLRRIDPQHRTLGQFFQDEIATPLGLDFYIRLPESIPD